KTIVSLKPKKRIEIKKFIKIAVWVIIAINVFQFVRPFFVTIEKIENDVLKIIPIGTSWDEAVEIIESKKKMVCQNRRGFNSLGIAFRILHTRFY
ncbi:MAG: hypothetical protein FWG70_05335, partial [Oscillospiraceae bacterium]|nr:hypothetical protein [Oscillospiraceae bacterium]